MATAASPHTEDYYLYELLDGINNVHDDIIDGDSCVTRDINNCSIYTCMHNNACMHAPLEPHLGTFYARTYSLLLLSARSRASS